MNELPRLVRINTGNKAVVPIGVFLTLLCMKASRFARNTLGDDFGVFIDKNRYGSPLFSLLDRFNNLGSGLRHGIGRDDRQTGILQDSFSQLFVGSFHAHHQRYG